MNLDLIRTIDKYLGTFLRLLLYYYQKVRDLFPGGLCKEPYERILIIKFWGIGNIVRTSPVLKAARIRFPKAHITFLTLSQNKGVYEDSGLFDETIYLNLQSVWAFLWDILVKFFQLKRRHFDLVLNLEPWANFAEIVAFYVGTRMRVGFTAPTRRSLFNVKVPFVEHEHITRSFFRILQPFGLKMPDDLRPLPIPLEEKDVKYVEVLLSAGGISSHDFIVAVNVNASDVADARRWMPQNFAQLADRLTSELQAKIVFVGAPSEKERVEEVIAMTKYKGICAAGKTNLKQAIALFARADVFVTNDSGPMHLAMAMRTPTVAMFGPETPARYGPQSDLHIAIFKNYDCSPCISFKKAKKIDCKMGARCMNDISVDEVFQAVVRLKNRKINTKPV